MLSTSGATSTVVTVFSGSIKTPYFKSLITCLIHQAATTRVKPDIITFPKSFGAILVKFCKKNAEFSVESFIE